MTPQEQAKAWALETTGLRWENLSAWTPAQRDAYLAANAQFRRDNPALFTPAEQAAADTYATFAATQLPEVDWVDVTLGALGESIAELPARINTAIDTAGKGVWGAIPSWSKWLAGGLVVIGGLVAALVWIPGARQVASASASRAADRIARKRPRKK
jgi:hypothetical protein